MKRMIRLTCLVVLILLNYGCFSVAVSERERLLTESRYSEAEKLIETEVSGETNLKSGDLAELCFVYSKLKKYNKLFPCIDRLDRYIKSGNRTSGKWGFGAGALPGNMAVPHQDLSPLPPIFRAEAYMELGDFKKAIELSKSAYRIAAELSAQRVSAFETGERLYRRYRIYSLGLLALSYALDGDRDTALKYVRELEKEPASFISGPAFVKDKLLSLSRVYVALKDYEKVLANKDGLTDAFGKVSYAIIGSDYFVHLDIPRTFVINKSLFETGKIQEAIKGYDDLLAKIETKSNGEIYWATLFDRGRISEQLGNGIEAIDYYKKAIDVIEGQRSTINTEAARIGFVGDKQEVYHQMISALYKENRFSEAFEYVERSKSRALVDLLASKHEFGVHGKSSMQVKSVLNDMKSIEEENHLFDVSSTTPDKVGQRNIRSIEIKKILKEETPELATLVTVTKVDANEIQTKLKKDETLIEYYYSGDDLYAFILTLDDLKAVKLTGTNLSREIATLRKSIEDLNSMQYMNSSGKLYDKLLKPLIQHIKTSKLIIVSHGALHYLPFASLQNNGKFLIDQYSVSHLPSASLVKFFKEKEHQKDVKILLFGNPDLGSPQFDLKYAEQEATTISRLYLHSILYLRGKATKNTFLKEASHYDYIHLATHGTFKIDSPLNSGIFLARDGKTDGFLSVNELFSLNLNSDLVTLSACETGLGKVSNGDDVVGFTRGFLYAGTNAIVSSLWKVDDLATSFLMTEFYSNLKAMSKREALRQAQLATKKKYESPYYWAAFQLTGKGD